MNLGIGGFVDGSTDPSGGYKVGIIFVFFQRGHNKIMQLGRDVFMFSVYKNGKILPGGWSTMKQDPLTCYSNAYACAQWVINNENLDYFKCKDLSWNGKRKCK